MKTNRLEPFEAAKKFVSLHFPDCHGAVLAGSIVRGEATHTSDLDIVVFSKDLKSAYRESFIVGGWPIEVFVHNLSSYKEYFESDCKRARPTLPKMVAEGLLLGDKGIMESIQTEARQLLENGPEPWSSDTITMKRYFITDALDDFIGSTKRSEEIFIAGSLAKLTSEFVLRTNGKWIGESKWIIRALRHYDGEFAEQFVDAFDLYYKTGDKNKVIKIVDDTLHPHGGRLFDGFSSGK